MYDAITIIPFAKIFYNAGKLSRLFNAIKIVRISKGYYLLSTSKFKQNIKAIFDKKLQQKIVKLKLDQGDVQIENFEDHTGIDTQINIIYTFRIIKLVITILGTSYFLGLFWYIVCDLKEIIESEDPNFIGVYFRDSQGPYHRTVASTYYAFTSLSTVGFGDFHPENSFERLFCALILLVGNGIFGYVLGMFREMVQEVRNLDTDENEDADHLNKFLSLLQHFNGNRPMSAQFKRRLEQYFAYRALNDRNYALGVYNQEDREMLEQLPEDVQIKIYKFLFTEFLYTFRTFFTFFKPTKADAARSVFVRTIRLNLYTW